MPSRYTAACSSDDAAPGDDGVASGSAGSRAKGSQPHGPPVSVEDGVADRAAEQSVASRCNALDADERKAHSLRGCRVRQSGTPTVGTTSLVDSTPPLVSGW